MVKQLRQVGGVREVKVTDFKQGIFAVTPENGARLSESALAEAVRLSGFTLQKIVTPEGTAETPASSEKGPEVNFDARLNAARKAFRQGEFATAGERAKKLLAALPDDKADQKQARKAEVGQLWALCYFALGDYEHASAAAHAALHRGQPWNWKTLSGNYVNVETYARHLRALEESVRRRPAVEKRFLLGYHYAMLGHEDAARVQFEGVLGQNAKDKVARELLKGLTERENNLRSQP